MIKTVGRVKVARNLNKDKLSIRKDGLVIGYADEILLKNCTFEVSESGRQRVLREGVKNVHAFVVGEQAEWKEMRDEIGRFENVTYNPYDNESFVTSWEGEPVYESEYCLIFSDGTILAWRYDDAR